MAVLCANDGKGYILFEGDRLVWITASLRRDFA